MWCISISKETPQKHWTAQQKLDWRFPNKLCSFMNDTNCVQIIFFKMFDSARTIGLGCKYLHVLTTFSSALI
jgi:hypothetical protein